MKVMISALLFLLIIMRCTTIEKKKLQWTANSSTELWDVVKFGAKIDVLLRSVEHILKDNLELYLENGIALCDNRKIADYPNYKSLLLN